MTPYQGKNFIPDYAGKVRRGEIKPSKPWSSASKPSKPKQQRSKPRGFPPPKFTCIVQDLHTALYMNFDGQKFIDGATHKFDDNVFRFPSKRKARTAIWKHVMQSGEAMSHTRWLIVIIGMQ